MGRVRGPAARGKPELEKIADGAIDILIQINGNY
jgi:hypothetical protein